jgi:hypothetical protein
MYVPVYDEEQMFIYGDMQYGSRMLLSPLTTYIHVCCSPACLRQEDAKAWHLKDAQELHEFLASVMANNAAHGGVSVDSDSGSDDDKDDDGKEGTANFDGGLTLAERRQQELHRSKLEMVWCRMNGTYVSGFDSYYANRT